MSKRVLDYDPITGITTHFEYIHEEDKTIISREQDVETILEINKAIANEPEAWRKGVKDSWAQYAKIPMIVLEKWLTERGVDAFKKENWEKNGPVWKLLNDPQYRYLKTTAKMHWG